MENATKALLIAAAVFMVVLVLSLLMIFWDDVSIYFTARHDEKMLQQLIEFNNKFSGYDGKEIRGNELVSIMNRIIDYNNYQADLEGYQPITITIDLVRKDDFKYGTEASNGSQSIIPNYGKITNRTGNPYSVMDSELIKVATISTSLVSFYNNTGKIPNLTDTKLQKMSAGIDTIVIDDDPDFNGYDDEYKEELRYNRDKFLTKVLGYDVSDVSIISNKEKFIKDVKTVTYQYRQYTMMKRAMFKCTSITYNETNGRVSSMNFEAILDEKSGKVEFD